MKIDPQEKEKVRQRILRRWFKVVAGLAVTLIFLVAGRFVLIRDDYSRFRDYCKTIAKDDLLERVRIDAEAHGYLWSQDPSPSGFPENPAFVIRPTVDWPYQFGCRVNAKGGVVVGVER